jgi:thiol-disulfide isomerase/thioredoxin
MTIVPLAFLVAALRSFALDQPSAPVTAATPTPTQPPRVESPSVGFHAPDFSFPTIDRHIVSLHDFRGDVVLVNFFATWCAPCQEEMPILVKAAALLAPFHIDFVGVDMDETKYELGKFQKRFSATTYPLVIDALGDEFRQYHFDAIPTTLILDGDGIVVYRITDELTGEKLSDILRAVADQKEGDASIGEQPLETYTYHIQSADDSGLLIVNITALVSGTRGIRLTERWQKVGTIASIVGTVAPTGAIDFGSQFVPPLSRSLLPYFGTSFSTGNASAWMTTSVVGQFVTTARYTPAAADSGGGPQIAEQSTVADVTGAVLGFTSSGSVHFDAAKHVPADGAFSVSQTANGDPATTGYSFTLLH